MYFQLLTKLPTNTSSCPLPLAHLPVKMGSPGRWGAFTGDNLWSWNIPQTSLFKERGRKALCRFHYLHLILWWTSLHTMLYRGRILGLCLFGSNQLSRGQNELPPHKQAASGRQRSWPQPAGGNWTDQTTNSLQGSLLRTQCCYCHSSCLKRWPQPPSGPCPPLPAPAPGLAFEVFACLPRCPKQPPPPNCPHPSLPRSL